METFLSRTLCAPQKGALQWIKGSGVSQLFGSSRMPCTGFSSNLLLHCFRFGKEPWFAMISVCSDNILVCFIFVCVYFLRFLQS